MKNKITLFIILAVIGLFANQITLAQNQPYEVYDIPVLPEFIKNPKRKYEAKPLLAASIGGKISSYYSDNIYRSPNGEENDIITILSPEFKLYSNMSDKYFSLGAKIEAGNFATNDENNYIDSDIKTRAKFNINDENEILADARLRIDHVAIGSFADASDRRALKPTDYRYGEANLHWNGDNGDYNHDFAIGSKFYDYDNLTRIDNSIAINDDRDRFAYEASGKIGYNINSALEIYSKISYNIREYNNRIDSSALFTRDSTGHRAAAGVKINDKHSQYWLDTNLSLITQDYDAVELPNIATLGAYMRAGFEASEDINLSVGLNRNIRESNLTASSAYLQTRSFIEATYLYNVNLLAGAKFRHTNNDFAINNSLNPNRREDDIMDSFLWIEYAIDESFSLRTHYNHINKSSNDADIEYQNNIILMQFIIRH